MLQLQTYTQKDAQRIVSWFVEEETFQKWAAGNLEWPLTEESFCSFAANQLEKEHAWLLTLWENGKHLVGFLCMTNIDYQKKSIHFCYIVVNPNCRGKGYGKQMLQLAVQYAVSLLQMRRMTIRVFGNNMAARQCYKKVGFYEEAYYPSAFSWKEQIWDAYDLAFEVAEKIKENEIQKEGKQNGKLEKYSKSRSADVERIGTVSGGAGCQ